MQMFRPVFFLFTLNMLDAFLTIFWVRNGYASEGNHLMARLLDIGDLPFLAVKIAVGAAAAIVLWRWSDLRLAKVGLGLALTLYIGLMGVHFLTGLSAFGLISDNFLKDFSVWTNTVAAIFI